MKDARISRGKKTGPVLEGVEDGKGVGAQRRVTP